MKNNRRRSLFVKFIPLPCAMLASAGTAHAQQLFTKPSWLPQLSLGVSESYDDNLLGVSGNGLKPQSSWVTKVSPSIGFDFAPLLTPEASIQKWWLNYTPEFAVYHEAPAESYDAHKVGSGIKGSAGGFSYSLDNNFLYNDGSKIAPTFALNQSGAASEYDKYRDVFGSAMERERRNQVQERENAVLQYDWYHVFVRAADSFLDYNLDTAWHNSKFAPYVGYQNYVDRSDVNGGMDLGYKMAPNLALTLGYRYGSQFQQQFPTSVTTDSHYSSSTYQRILLGVEGQPITWLNVKMAAGPDFRDYNTHGACARPAPDQVLRGGGGHGDDHVQPKSGFQLQAVDLGVRLRAGPGI